MCVCVCVCVCARACVISCANVYACVCPRERARVFNNPSYTHLSVCEHIFCLNHPVSSYHLIQHIESITSTYSLRATDDTEYLLTILLRHLWAVNVKYGDTAPKYADKKESQRIEQVEINVLGPVIDLSKSACQTAFGARYGLSVEFIVRKKKKK